jgi:hypothetical protein
VPTLFPPLRSGYAEISPWRVLRVLGPAAAFVFLLFLTLPLFVPLPSHLSPFVIALAGGGQMLVLAMAGAIPSLSRKSRERMLDRLKEAN